MSNKMPLQQRANLATKNKPKGTDMRAMTSPVYRCCFIFPFILFEKIGKATSEVNAQEVARIATNNKKHLGIRKIICLFNKFSQLFLK